MVTPPIPSNIQRLEEIIDAIILAGEVVREIYQSDFEVNKKDDNSPITKADLESNKIIKSYLEKREQK